MLLQTNSYIVPKEKRAEHTRLMRRFRQLLNQLGCDNFEVYEQVGANWNNNQTSGRFVQIMRFRDRKHQLAVQNAERTDAAAQQLIAEFCDLINYPYQQQQGQFAVGFYSSVLPVAPARVQPGGAAEEMAAPDEGAEAAPDAATASLPAMTDAQTSSDVIDAGGVQEASVGGDEQCLDGVAGAPAADAPVEALSGEQTPAPQSPAAQEPQAPPMAAQEPQQPAVPQAEQVPAHAEPAQAELPAAPASAVPPQPPAPSPAPQVAAAPPQPPDASTSVAATPAAAAAAAAAEQILAQPPQEVPAPTPSPAPPSSPPPMGIIFDAASAHKEPEESLDASAAGNANAAAAAQPANGEFNIDEDVEMSEDDLARLAAELASDDSGVHTPPANDLQGHPLNRAAENSGH